MSEMSAACELLREIEKGRDNTPLVTAREPSAFRPQLEKLFRVRGPFARVLNDVWRALLYEAGQSMIYEGNSVIAYRSNSRSARTIVKHDRHDMRGARSAVRRVR